MRMPVDPVFIAMVNWPALSQGRIDQFCVQCHLPVATALNMTDVFFDERLGANQDVTNIPPEVKKGDLRCLSLRRRCCRDTKCTFNPQAGRYSARAH